MNNSGFLMDYVQIHETGSGKSFAIAIVYTIIMYIIGCVSVVFMYSVSPFFPQHVPKGL